MINFLRYIADKELSLTEYPVLTIIYMDTRYRGGSYRTIRGFTENTPFKISASAVLAAINSLIDKGYIQKEINQRLGMFYIAKGVESEKTLLLIEQINEQNDKQPKKKKTKKEFVKPERSEIYEFMKNSLKKYFGDNVQNDFIQNVANQFYDYWDNLNWSDNKGKIKSVKNRVAYWARKEAKAMGYDVAPFTASSTGKVADIYKEIIAIYEPFQFQKNWLNDRKKNLIEEQARAFYAQMAKKNWQLLASCKTWQEELQIFAAEKSCPLRLLNPDYVPKTKQEREAKNELYTGHTNSEPITADGLKTLALIQRLRQEHQEKNNAK